jgi:hypothetical protein
VFRNSEPLPEDIGEESAGFGVIQQRVSAGAALSRPWDGFRCRSRFQLAVSCNRRKNDGSLPRKRVRVEFLTHKFSKKPSFSSSCTRPLSNCSGAALGSKMHTGGLYSLLRSGVRKKSCWRMCIGSDTRRPMRRRSYGETVWHLDCSVDVIGRSGAAALARRRTSKVRAACKNES